MASPWSRPGSTASKVRPGSERHQCERRPSGGRLPLRGEIMSVQHAAPVTIAPNAAGALAQHSLPATGRAGAPIDVTAAYGFDLRSPAFIADPYPVYARLRAGAPVMFDGRRWF